MQEGRGCELEICVFHTSLHTYVDISPNITYVDNTRYQSKYSYIDTSLNILEDISLIDIILSMSIDISFNM